MALTVRRSGGVVVECAGDGVVLDPTSEPLRFPAFVSHAHVDHAAAFRFPALVKYATEPTLRLLEAGGWSGLGERRPLRSGGRVRVGDLEVRAHNAGHILGSVQFEVATAEGTVLYTGDFNGGESYTMEPAEPVGCDLLVVESTFGAPMFAFPRRLDIALEMVRWATLEVIPGGRVPTLRTDSIGNAQEVIHIFNRMTRLPVVTARSVTRASDVYVEYGHDLDYVDAESEEGRELLDSGRCVLVTPKGSRPGRENLEISLASGWAAITGGKAGRPFPLSDHADFRGLLSFIRRCRPKRVLTTHGGGLSSGFAEYVNKRLGIAARPLTGSDETLMGPAPKGEARLRACSDQLLAAIRIPGFVYLRAWLVREMGRRGFTRGETEATIQRLVERGVLDNEGQGVRLRLATR